MTSIVIYRLKLKNDNWKFGYFEKNWKFGKISKIEKETRKLEMWGENWKFRIKLKFEKNWKFWKMLVIWKKVWKFEKKLEILK